MYVVRHKRMVMAVSSFEEGGMHGCCFKMCERSQMHVKVNEEDVFPRGTEVVVRRESQAAEKTGRQQENEEKIVVGMLC